MQGKCKLLKIYISEDSKYKKHGLYHEIVHRLKDFGIAGVTVSRGIEGYGQDKVLHSSRVLEISQSLPIVIEAVDEAQKIDDVLPLIEDIVNEGLVLVTEVNVIKQGNGKTQF
jgi:PII-like signaling protein